MRDLTVVERPGEDTKPDGEDAIRGHVVVIDDEASFREVLRIGLGLEGFRVSTAGDGAKGLDLVSRAAADAVVLDVRLADGDGLESLVRLRAMGEVGQIPVVVLTAEDGDGCRERGRALGADRYLTKPVDMQLLVWTLDELLARRRPVRVNPLSGLRHRPTIPSALL